jgi:cytidine deaminase
LADKGLLEDKSVSPKNSDWEKEVKIMTLEELLPMSFGPEHLDMTV